MAKNSAVEELLSQWKIEKDEDQSQLKHRLMPTLNTLSKSLKAITLAVFELNEIGEALANDSDDDEKKKKAADKKRQEQLNQFDQLPANDRKKVFAAISPDLAEWIEAAWQLMKTTPYVFRRAFRAPNSPQITLLNRVEWLRHFALMTASIKVEALNPVWLARWAKHAFPWRDQVVVPVLAATMNVAGPLGDEVFDVLYKTVTREDPIGIMSDHVIQSLLLSNRQSGWEIMEKTLLAAQRQEGLRQSILENADESHPEAFRRLLRLILDQDLIRFSSVARCVNVWLGLLWDSISTKALSQNVESLLHFIESPADRKKALAGDDAEQIYRALCASAYEDAIKTVPVAEKLLRHSREEVRFVATWILTLTSLELAEKAKLPAIDDPSLHVALLAAVKTKGISQSDESISLVSTDTYDKHAFEKLEQLYLRLPEKPQKLAAIVWPWTERKIERSMLSWHLYTALGDRAPTRMIPYLKGLESWHQFAVVRLLAAQKKWDSLTRSTLLELVGHSSSDIRKVACESLAKQTLQGPELLTLEDYLTRTTADLRIGVVGLLLNSEDGLALASADRLLAKGDRNQRLAGLELLRQMAEANRNRTICRHKAAEYRSSRKALTKEEEGQLSAIDDSDRAVLSLDNALGLMDPSGRSPVFTPKKKKVLTISKAAIECLKSLDELIHSHRTTIVTVEHRKTKEDKPLGELSSYEFPTFTSARRAEPQLNKVPLFEVWKAWADKRTASLRDKDGLELLRSECAIVLFDGWRFENVVKFCRKGDQQQVAIAVLGEVSAPNLRYKDVIWGVLQCLCFYTGPKNGLDFLLDCIENSYACVPDTMMKELDGPQRPNRSWSGDEGSDWRAKEVFRNWPRSLTRFRRTWEQSLTVEQSRRVWDLERFHDEPYPGAPRRRLDLQTIAFAYRNKLATMDDLADCLLGERALLEKRFGQNDSFDELRNYTKSPLAKETKAVLDQTPGLVELLDKARHVILESELVRGETPIVTTQPALHLSSLKGTSTLFRIMSALNKGKLKVDRGWIRGNDESRSATLTHLMKITHPAVSDTSTEFAKQVKLATAEGYCNEERLLELTFLAPQWSRFVGDALGWDGFSEGLYWFLAHMNTWFSDATEAAATAEGLAEDAPDDSHDPLESVDGSDDDETENAREPVSQPRMSAWERLVMERTPLDGLARSEGEVDVAWFHRTWESLGAKRWQQMANAAKFAANSAQANKAQFLADVLLGKKSRTELVEGIQKKFRKEYVRLLGLLPLATGAKRSKDVIERYEVLQGYKKYARGLSSLTKPSAMRAVEIGMNNLARLAGFPDPLRMEWALEAESIRDIAKGPVSVTKDGITVTLRLDEYAMPQISVMKDNKPLKAIPAPVKKKHAAIAELSDRAAELKRKSSRIKQSLENAMCRGDQITAAEVVQLCEHAILAPQLAKLVLIGDGIMGYPDKGGKVLRGYDGKLEPIKKDEHLRIAHAHDLLASGDWHKWQQECFRAERIQPFKQIFRELYVITAQEKKDGTASSRFAGQQIGPKQAMALWNSRGWNTEDGVCRIFHDLSLIADVSFQYDCGTAAEIEGLTMDQVAFRRRDEVRPLRLTEIPGVVFSETMRDVDLVVSVAHRGQVDPEASASTVEMRIALARETSQILKLANVKFKGNHAIIDGYYGEYSLHMGSGGVQRLPGGALTILPVHAQHRGRLFLPFADDDPRTAEIIAKVLLLARDEEIMDPMILDQLGAPIGKRKVVQHDEPVPQRPQSKKRSESSDGAPSSGASSGDLAAVGASSGKRYFTFQDETSNKFWEVELSGVSVTTRWGRIGADGQSKTKEFSNAEKAKTEYDKLVKEKVGKGYVES